MELSQPREGCANGTAARGTDGVFGLLYALPNSALKENTFSLHSAVKTRRELSSGKL